MLSPTSPASQPSTNGVHNNKINCSHPDLRKMASAGSLEGCALNRSIAVVALLTTILTSGCGAPDQGAGTSHKSDLTASQSLMFYMPIWWRHHSYLPVKGLSITSVGKKIGVVGAYPEAELDAYITIPDAEQLPIGTPLFQVAGASTSNEIAVEVSPGHYIAAPLAVRY